MPREPARLVKTRRRMTAADRPPNKARVRIRRIPASSPKRTSPPANRAKKINRGKEAPSRTIQGASSRAASKAKAARGKLANSPPKATQQTIKTRSKVNRIRNRRVRPGEEFPRVGARTARTRPHHRVAKQNPGMPRILITRRNRPIWCSIVWTISSRKRTLIKNCSTSWGGRKKNCASLSNAGRISRPRQRPIPMKKRNKNSTWLCGVWG